MTILNLTALSHGRPGGTPTCRLSSWQSCLSVRSPGWATPFAGDKEHPSER